MKALSPRFRSGRPELRPELQDTDRNHDTAQMKTLSRRNPVEGRIPPPGWEVPGFFQRSVEAVRSWGRSFILGFVVLVAVPVAIVLAGLTLVGIPVALTGLGLYLLGLFAAKILVGAVIGRALLRCLGLGAFAYHLYRLARPQRA
jgi:VIT1/CCC1 family predicted Fe2+/Mn2+ transporter